VSRALTRPRSDAGPKPSGSRLGELVRRVVANRSIVAAVAAGGLVGSLARFGVTTLWQQPRGAFPFAILTVNLAGCAALGFLDAADRGGARLSHRLRAGLGAGLIGAFTTFSAFAVGTVQLCEEGRWAWAGAYLGASVGGGLLMIVLGAATARTAWHRPLPRRYGGTLRASNLPYETTHRRAASAVAGGVSDVEAEKL
jgi:CrcB protein